MGFDPPVKQLTKEQAIALAKSGEWKNWSHEERARRQMCQTRLFMDFGAFHESVEKTLGRGVWTHEFGLNYKGLYDEMFNGGEPPTIEEIMDLIPPEKRIVVVVDGSNEEG